FHHPTAAFFEIMLLLGIGTACANIARRRFTEPLLILLWAHGALLAARNIPIFVIVGAPAIAAALHQWIAAVPQSNVAAWVKQAAERFNRMATETGETERVARWHIVSGLAVAMVAAVLWAPSPPKKFRAEFDPARYPAGALASLRQDAARIFTTD